MNLVKTIPLLLISLFLLGGCYDKKELEEYAYVTAIGLDKAKEEGEIDVTFQITNPEVGTSSKSTADEPATQDVTLNANDIYSAQNKANAFVTKEITLEHTKVLIISEELARSDEFLKVIQMTVREGSLRENISMIVTKEKASEFIKNHKSPFETRSHKYYYFMLQRAGETGNIPEATIHRFFQITEGDADLYLAIYATADIKEDEFKQKNDDEYIAGEINEKGGKSTQLMGSAVFKEGKMIDTLTGEETRIAMILDNTLDIKDLLTTYRDPKEPKYRISVRLLKSKGTQVKINPSNGKTKIEVEVPINVQIVAVPSMYPYNSDDQAKKELATSIEEELEKATRKLIEKTQKEYKSEPFYWSLYERMHHRTISSFESADWNKKIYPNADISVNYQIVELRFGKKLKDNNLREVKD